MTQDLTDDDLRDLATDIQAQGWTCGGELVGRLLATISALQPREAGEDREVLARMLYEFHPQCDEEDNHLVMWDEYCGDQDWEGPNIFREKAERLIAAGFRRASPSAAPVVTRDQLFTLMYDEWKSPLGGRLSAGVSREIADTIIAQHGGKIIEKGTG